MLNREEVRHALTGPIMSLHTPFHRNGDIDYEGVRRIIDYTVDEGGFIPTLDHLVTWDVSYENWLYYLDLKRKTVEGNY